MFRITENSPWKLVLLQIATKSIKNCGKLADYKLQKNVITNCVSWLITNCNKTIANCDRYYKLLQIVIAIRNCNSYYKLRLNRKNYVFFIIIMKKIWKRLKKSIMNFKHIYCQCLNVLVIYSQWVILG